VSEFYLFSASQKGLYGSTHLSIAFLPINTFTSPDEVACLKAELRDSTRFDSTPGLKKQRKLLEQWFNDERHAQLECVDFFFVLCRVVPDVASIFGIG
jgi:hypothetical protein